MTILLLKILNLAIALIASAHLVRVLGKSIQKTKEARPEIKKLSEPNDIADTPITKLYQMTFWTFIVFLVLNIPVLNLLLAIYFSLSEDEAAGVISESLVATFDKKGSEAAEE